MLYIINVCVYIYINTTHNYQHIYQGNVIEVLRLLTIKELLEFDLYLGIYNSKVATIIIKKCRLHLELH